MHSSPLSSKLTPILVTVLLSLGLQSYASFTQPSTSAPNADAYAPLTTSPTAQVKVGGLLLNTGGATNGLIVQSGNSGFGVASPAYRVDVSGDANVTGCYRVNGTCLSTGGTNLAQPTVTGAPAYVKSHVICKLTPPVAGSVNFWVTYTYGHYEAEGPYDIGYFTGAVSTIYFNTDGTFKSANNESDCSTNAWSLQQLITMGRAFD